MTYRAIVFDLDGTLLDTLEDLADSMNEVLAERGFPTHPVDAYRYFVGSGIVDLVALALPEPERTEARIAECVAGMREVYGRRWDNRTLAYDGVPELLDALTERGVKMAVLSNKPDGPTKLAAQKLLPRWRFERVYGQRDGVPKKPDPAGAIALAAELGVEPSECLYLGDSGSDMQTAVAAGMFPAGALWGFRTADELTEAGARALIAHPAQLLELL
jgi:phosphoglycolate phosphatase